MAIREQWQGARREFFIPNGKTKRYIIERDEFLGLVGRSRELNDRITNLYGTSAGIEFPITIQPGQIQIDLGKDLRHQKINIRHRDFKDGIQVKRRVITRSGLREAATWQEGLIFPGDNVDKTNPLPVPSLIGTGETPRTPRYPRQYPPAPDDMQEDLQQPKSRSRRKFLRRAVGGAVVLTVGFGIFQWIRSKTAPEPTYGVDYIEGTRITNPPEYLGTDGAKDYYVLAPKEETPANANMFISLLNDNALNKPITSHVAGQFVTETDRDKFLQKNKSSMGKTNTFFPSLNPDLNQNAPYVVVEPRISSPTWWIIYFAVEKVKGKKRNPSYDVRFAKDIYTSNQILNELSRVFPELGGVKPFIETQLNPTLPTDTELSTHGSSGYRSNYSLPIYSS